MTVDHRMVLMLFVGSGQLSEITGCVSLMDNSLPSVNLNEVNMDKSEESSITSKRAKGCRFSSSGILLHRPRLITITLCATKDIYHEYN